MSKQLTKSQANAMWTDLRGHFVNAEKCVAEIIANKAWVPLGYPSFAAAWADRMQGVPLATDSVRAHVVYAMVEANLTDDEVLEATGIGSQVGPRSIEALRRQHDLGVPPDLATTRVRAHVRSAPSSPRFVRVALEPDEYEEFRALAKELDTDPTSLATSIIRERIAQGVMV
jgi:hypothetical protein